MTEVDTAEKDEVATIEDGQVENGFDHDAEEEDSESGEDRRGRRGRRRQGGRGHAKEADEIRAKRIALASMLVASLVMLIFAPVWGWAIGTACMVVVAIWLWRRPEPLPT